MISVELQVGRLVEIRVSGAVTVAEVTAFRSAFMRILATHLGSVIIGTDWRGAAPFDDDIRSMFLGIARTDNPRVELSGWLAPDPETRDTIRALVEQTRHPSRLHFDDAEVMAGWLAAKLTHPEASQLREFLRLPPHA